jgi:hypothetical protein
VADEPHAARIDLGSCREVIERDVNVMEKLSQAARGADALAGDKEPLTAPLRITVIGGDIPGLAAAGVVAALPNSRSMSTKQARN